jgi:hypothetical protein
VTLTDEERETLLSAGFSGREAIFVGCGISVADRGGYGSGESDWRTAPFGGSAQPESDSGDL